MSNNPKAVYELLVDHFGGQEKTASALGVSQPAVSSWVRGKAKMSVGVAIRVQRQTNGTFKAVDLCPAIKSDLEQLIA